MEKQSIHSIETIDAQIDRVIDGSVVVENTLSALDETSNKPVSGKGIASAISAEVEPLSASDTITEFVQRGETKHLSSLFRIGNISILNTGWVYGESKRRVSTKEGVTIPLITGDTISLSDYSIARFYLGWKNKDGVYKSSGWHTQDVTITQDGEYVINIAKPNGLEEDLSSKEELLDLLHINNKTIIGRLSHLENDVSGISLSLISSLKLPNFDTSNKVLDLGDDPVLIVGKNYYALKGEIDESKYRSIPYVIEGVTSGAIKIVFNTKTLELYPLNYGQTLADEEVVIGSVRLTWGSNGKFVHANMPFDFTVDGKTPTTEVETEVQRLAEDIADTNSKLFSSEEDYFSRIKIIDGHCNGETGVITTPSTTGTRLISQKKLSLNGTFIMDATNVKGKTLKFYVVKFNKSDGSLVDWSGWYSPLTLQYYEFKSDFLYVLSFGFTDDSRITPADVKDVKFYNVTAREKQELLCDIGLSFIAHRGFTLNGIPENSLDAYRYAARCGFKYVETDICPTSDGELVLMHDESINRTMRNKADYSEIVGEVNVIDKTLEELRGNYVLSAADSRMRREIPTLEEFLVTCRSCGLFPILEIKGNHFTNGLLEKSFVLAVEIMGDGNFGYCSFSEASLDYMRSLSDKIPLLYIIRGGLVGTTNTVTHEGRESENTWWYPPYPGYSDSYGASKESIRSHRSKGLKVAMWSPPVSQVDGLLKLGVDAIASSTVAPNIGRVMGHVAKSDTDFDDFSTDGIMESNGISLSRGQLITTSFGSMWLGSYFLSIIGYGNFSVEAPNLKVDINNEKVERYLFQGLIDNSMTTLTIRAKADSFIESIEYKAVEL